MYKIPATTTFLGKNLIFMPECHSTSDQLLLLCQEKPLLEGSLVITGHQTAGRGQRGNSWEAQPGKNLTFSFLLKPEFLAVSDQFYLTMVVSLGIRDFLTDKTGSKVQIKWPNDILIDQRKICGILIENQIVGQRLGTCIVGVGVNVNQQYFETPSATSMVLVTGMQFDLPIMLEELLTCIEQRYLQLRRDGQNELRSDYHDALYLRGEKNLFYTGDTSFYGTIKGVDEIGRLNIDIEGQSTLSTFSAKEIRYGEPQ